MFVCLFVAVTLVLNILTKLLKSTRLMLVPLISRGLKVTNYIGEGEVA